MLVLLKGDFLSTSGEQVHAVNFLFVRLPDNQRLGRAGRAGNLSAESKHSVLFVCSGCFKKTDITPHNNVIKNST